MHVNIRFHACYSCSTRATSRPYTPTPTEKPKKKKKAPAKKKVSALLHVVLAQMRVCACVNECPAMHACVFGTLT